MNLVRLGYLFSYSFNLLFILILGRVPMRRLVYRVQPLPQSMLPLVWDFGQLNAGVEELYIRQMVLRYVRNHAISYCCIYILHFVIIIYDKYCKDLTVTMYNLFAIYLHPCVLFINRLSSETA